MEIKTLQKVPEALDRLMRLLYAGAIENKEGMEEGMTEIMVKLIEEAYKEGKASQKQ